MNRISAQATIQDIKSVKSSFVPFGQSVPLNIGQVARYFGQNTQVGHIPDSGVAQSVTNMSMNYTYGNRNYCSKHKRKLVNFCLDHGQALCSDCFKDHQGHKIEMLENYAQAEVTKVQQLVEHLENSIRHVKEKLELRRNLNEKKEIAAKQFFELTHRELDRIEQEFWVNFQKEKEEEVVLFDKLHDQQALMEQQYEQIKPKFERLEQKISLSEFFDIIESKADIWHLNEAFKYNKQQFYDIVNSAEDYELIFDKLECRQKLEEYLKKQLAVKVHQHELIEVRDKAIYFYQPFKGNKRRVRMEDDQLTENPTLVNTKETGRLLIIGGNKGYRSSRKVYQVDECMNALILHSKMNFGRVGHAAVYINNKDIYVIGGYNSNANKWLASVELYQDAFSAINSGHIDQNQNKWEVISSMNQARYYFGCTTWGNEHIFVFGGMNEQFMLPQLQEGQSKCLNSIERYSVECNRWDLIELKTYQKFPFLSHLVAVHLPWDKDRILIVGGQTYNKKTEKFENLGCVYKFDPNEDKLKACKDLAIQDRFLMGMGISDGAKQVSTLGEKAIHLFNGEKWITLPREEEKDKSAPTEQ